MSIALHYFYLFDRNLADVNWLIGCYVTILASTLLHFTRRALFTYSIFVVLLAIGITSLHEELQNSIFLPGFVTIVALACLGILTRLRMIESLEASGAKFELLFNSTFEGVAMHTDGKIMDANDAYAKIFGYEKSEMTGKRVLDLVHPDSLPHVLVELSKQDHSRYETFGLRKDGSSIPIEVRARTLYEAGMPVRIGSVRDLTEQRKAEKEHALRLSAQEAVRTRDEFISLASHELRTPLTALKLAIEFNLNLIESGKKTSLEGGELLQLFKKFDARTERLVAIVEDLLDVSRISLGKLALTREPVNLGAVVARAMESLDDVITRERATIELRLDSKIEWIGDPARLEQVVVNLLTNALKYGDHKPVEVILERIGEMAQLRVVDRGIGIAEDKIPLIFNRFERAISGRNISGLGLGLYICKQIVEGHGGRIRAESVLGHGTTVTVEFPLSN